MAVLQETSAFQYENFYRAQLTADISASSTDIFLDIIPVGSEGTLIINPDSSTSREIIYYNSKTITKVVCPSAALGRGYDNTTATTHTSGTTVIMAPIADWFNSLRTLFTTTPQGYTSVGYTPATTTANGNRSYTQVFTGVDLTGTISPGMRLKETRTVTAPTQCTDLESSSSQYFSKTTPNGMTFTDDFVVSAWVKLESYTAGTIASRFNGTSGWIFDVLSTGQLQLTGFNAGVGNFSSLKSYQSLSLNKWVYVVAQLDMSAFTATTTTSYAMFDGADVPVQVQRAGTNPTALIQAGNLEIGSHNASNFFDGKLAQVAIYSAKVTQATVRASMNQTLTGSETSLISAYSFNNSINDLNANANNLTANGGALATNLDTPFTQTQQGITTGTTNYAIVTSASFSTDTTLVVQVPEGDTLPTSGGISAVSYSTQASPYGFPAVPKIISSVILGATFTTSSVTFVPVTGLTTTVTIPSGVPYRVHLRSSAMYNTSAAVNTFAAIYDGAVPSGVNLAYRQFVTAAANYTVGLDLVTSVQSALSAATSKTFNAALGVSAGTGGIQSGNAGGFAYLEVELLNS